LENNGQIREVLVDGGGEGRRIDQYLAQAGVSFSRAHIQKMIKDGSIAVNGEPCKQSHRLRAGDKISIAVPRPKDLKAAPENIPLNIVYEDNDIVVINKPAGMVVHPAAGNYSGTLVNALLHHFDKLSRTGGDLRPGIVHRLDKDTSGLMIVAKNDRSHVLIAKQIKDRAVEKKYIALVHGRLPKDCGVIESRIGRNPRHRKRMTVITSAKHKSKDATTHYKVLSEFRNYSLLELNLLTGRTHQIRVHLSSIGNPIVGDSTYGRASNEFGVKRQLLHAQSLSFKHPVTGKLMEFSSAMPDDLKCVLERLGQR
jgi:23S rRNA pseudouridine1911/1915/1917 synthase